MTPHPDRFTLPSLDGVHLHALHWGSPDDPKLVEAVKQALAAPKPTKKGETATP